MGKLVKRHHSDNAKERRKKNLLAETISKGTQATSKSPHSSEQNAYVERRFEETFAATRATLAISGL